MCPHWTAGVKQERGRYRVQETGSSTGKRRSQNDSDQKHQDTGHPQAQETARSEQRGPQGQEEWWKTVGVFSKNSIRLVVTMFKGELVFRLK